MSYPTKISLRAAIVSAFACGALTAAAVPTYVLAQTAGTASTRTAPAAYHAVRASELIGKNVEGTGKKKVGEIKDVIVNMTTGDVRYALLEFDPGFFKADKLFAVPLSALKFVGTDRKTLQYEDMSREKLEKASVDKADWQKAVDNRAFVDRVDQNYGYKPPGGTARSFRASKLIGMDVNSRAGKDIGDIKELVIDVSAAKVHYAVLAFDPSWVSREKLYAFPLTAFRMTGDKDELILDVDKPMVERMKNFDEKRWGSLNDLNTKDFLNPAPAPMK